MNYTSDLMRLVNELGFDQRDIDYVLLYYSESTVVAYKTLRPDKASKEYVQELIDNTYEEHPIQDPGNYATDVIDGLEMRVYSLVDIQCQVDSFIFHRLSTMPHFSNYYFDLSWSAYEGDVYRVAGMAERNRSKVMLQHHIRAKDANKKCKLWFVNENDFAFYSQSLSTMSF